MSEDFVINLLGRRPWTPCSACLASNLRSISSLLQELIDCETSAFSKALGELDRALRARQSLSGLEVFDRTRLQHTALRKNEIYWGGRKLAKSSQNLVRGDMAFSRSVGMGTGWEEAPPLERSMHHMRCCYVAGTMHQISSKDAIDWQQPLFSRIYRNFTTWLSLGEWVLFRGHNVHRWSGMQRLYAFLMWLHVYGPVCQARTPKILIGNSDSSSYSWMQIEALEPQLISAEDGERMSGIKTIVKARSNSGGQYPIL